MNDLTNKMIIDNYVLLTFVSVFRFMYKIYSIEKKVDI